MVCSLDKPGTLCLSFLDSRGYNSVHTRSLLKLDNTRQIHGDTGEKCLLVYWGWEETGVIVHGGEVSFMVMDMFSNNTVVMGAQHEQYTKNH